MDLFSINVHSTSHTVQHQIFPRHSSKKENAADKGRFVLATKPDVRQGGVGEANKEGSY